MNTIQIATVQQPTTAALRPSASRWLVPGLTAGAVFLGIELLAGWLTTSLWSFPEAIAEMIGVPPSWSLPVGIIVHFTFSLGLGAVFVALAERFQLRGLKLLAAGVLFIMAESPISIWLVLNTLYPTTLPILFAAVPFWASLLGRIAFGLTLAGTYARITR
ncbi:MAG: hypothetical protein JO352_00345 [Chloroflexi bacterium]|nr:hypothetical protein [Chloroflexota bacterium]MBV9597577.1 hypothetical protein [Chloroflexota bacterium]